MPVMPDFLLKYFGDLSPLEVYRIMQLRSEVFVVEQNCVYQDLDNKDIDAHHLFLMEGGECLACCRILKPGVSYPAYSSIGRVVASTKARGRQVGRALMEKAIKTNLSFFPDNDIKISAQAYLQKFYESLGFEWTGEAYLEDDIPHLGMIYKVVR